MHAIGLAGTRKVRRAEMFRSVAGAIRLLRKRVVATTADDNGAINVWQDRESAYRCEAYRRMVTIDSRKFSNQRKVRAWIVKWQKKIA